MTHNSTHCSLPIDAKHSLSKSLRSLQIQYSESEWPNLYCSMLEVIVDVSLQAGLSYASVVRPRVELARKRWPNAYSLLDVYDLIDDVGIKDVLSWKHYKKCNLALNLCDFFFCEGIDSIGSAREWLSSPSRRLKLHKIDGVGHKTSAYIAKIVGVDAIAVDRHILRYIRKSTGISLTIPQASLLINYTCEKESVPKYRIDSMIWKFETNQLATCY